MAITISSINGGSVEYSDDASFAAAGKFVDSFDLGECQFGFAVEYAPGVDGGGTKNYGARSQTVEFEVYYVGGSADDCYTTAQADNVAMANGPCSFDGFGVTLESCLLKKFKTTKSAKSTGLPEGNFYMKVSIVLESVAPTGQSK